MNHGSHALPLLFPPARRPSPARRLWTWERALEEGRCHTICAVAVLAKLLCHKAKSCYAAQFLMTAKANAKARSTHDRSSFLYSCSAELCSCDRSYPTKWKRSAISLIRGSLPHFGGTSCWKIVIAS